MIKKYGYGPLIGIALIGIGWYITTSGDQTPLINPKNLKPMMRTRDVIATFLMAIGVFILLASFGFLLD